MHGVCPFVFIGSLILFPLYTRVQDWPEATDPHKFVYEDIAIATYLIVSCGLKAVYIYIVLCIYTLF